MASGPSVGDILMLSQLAWKIGRAFTQGRKGALSEFSEVEREANGLSEALKLVAETLYSDNSILTQADEHTRHAVSTILDSAHKTLSDLESFVERYRVIKKKETKGGFVVERAWSEVVIANYKTLKWTTEGGDITELRNMLHMHTTTIDLTMQALQSKSLSRLERTVIPMAENVASIHDAVHGELSAKIDDLHRIIMSVANSTPSLKAIDDDDDDEEPGRRPSVTSETTTSPNSPISLRSRQSTRSPQDGPPRIPIRHPARPSSPPVVQRTRGDSAYFSREYEKRMDWRFESGSPPPDRTSIGVSMSVPPSGSTAVATPSSNTFMMEDEPNVLRRESLTVPRLFSTFDDEASPDAYVPEKLSPREKYDYFPRRYVQPPTLPPPALPTEDEEVSQTPATPSSFFSRPKRTESNLSAAAGAPRPGTAKSRKRDSLKADGPTISDAGQKFEKSLFRNAAILCDVRGSLVEFAQHLPDEPDPRYNTEMVEACKECRIFVIRKRENRPSGGFKVISAIWAISDDGTVRVQQQLSEYAETVPYCSYFQPEKVSLPPTYGDMVLRFHPEVWGEDLQKESRSNWINYIFESEEGANQFQSAIFGRTLLGSFRTTKTTVIHDGFKGAFALEEQFANIEVLRLWEDDGVTTAGAGGGVLALMHLGSNFGEGWARWWMNSSKQHVRVKDEQTKFARIKGIDIRTVKPGASAEKARQASIPADESVPRKKSTLEKRVTGVRIEFKNEEERARFVELAKRVQERMLPLPDV
ncbi:hypothetical protein AMS68_004907 [Peltaster fructicola]|uniref:Fungal N-terminal domain-containing protein n=1 Tax=Peltaster fructicola TaxID=286661 RepID=A0A6H0XY96_9PEZI|nr:hypothetical protein AMS68_004907 [Peltaster fructicola]